MVQTNTNFLTTEDMEGLLTPEDMESFITPENIQGVKSFLTPEDMEGLITPADVPVAKSQTSSETLTPDDLKIFSSSVSTDYDPDDFSSKLDVGIENMKASITEGYGLLADMLGFDETAKENRVYAEGIRKELSSRPQPTQTPSITAEAGDIYKKFSEGDVLEGFNKMAGQAETLTATALPSMAPAIGGNIAARATGQWLKLIPRVGTHAYWLYKTVGTLFPAYLQGSGQVYKTAKDLGAKEEDAKLAATGGGLVIAALDSIAAGYLVKNAVNTFGLKATKDMFQKEFGKEVADKVVKEGLKKASPSFIKETMKKAGTGFAKGAALEGSTEAAQEVIAIASSHAAAEKTMWTMKSLHDTIDAAALGIFGGGPVRGLTDSLSPAAMNQAINKTKEIEESVEKLPEQVVNANRDLANVMETGATKKQEQRTKGPGFFQDFLLKPVQRATSHLQAVANRTTLGSQLLNEFNNFFIDTHQEIGTANKQLQNILRPLYKSFKIPMTKKLPKQVNDAIFNQLRTGKKADNVEVANAADGIRKILNGLYKEAQDNNVPFNYVENYISQSFKIPMTLMGRKKAKRKIISILNEDPKLDGAAILDNVIEHNNIYTPSKTASLFDEATPQQMQAMKSGFELPRQIPQKTIDKLDAAGLIERNVEGLVNRSIVGTKRRVRIQNIKDRYDKRQKELKLEGSEASRIQDIFQALQNNYKPFSSKSQGKYLRPIYQFANTAGYITTLPLAAITSLSEPIIVLTRVSPKNAIWGLINGVRTSSRKIARSFFPQMKRNKLEESMANLMQTADLALVDTIRDIGDLSINKKITDKFFRLNLLAGVTQFSRYIAFDAAQNQIKDDVRMLKIQELMKTNKIKEDLGDINQFREARKRLKYQGLGNLFPPSGRSPMTNKDEIIAWSEGQATAPDIITKAIGKTVDEVIMTPNVVNRPLWMSNPWLSPFAQLKGFMMVFGNTVGMKMYKDLARPAYQGRLPAADIMKYSITLTLLLSAMYGTQMLKDVIKYGDEDSPADELDGPELLWHLVKQSNLLGFGNVLADALKSEQYGIPVPFSAAGPVPVKSIQLASAMESLISKGDLKKLANWLSKNTPIIGMFSYDNPLREGLRETIEEIGE